MHVRLRRDSLTSDSDAYTEYSCAIEDIKLEPSWDQNDVIPLDNLSTSRQVAASNNRWPSPQRRYNAVQNDQYHTNSHQMEQSVVPLPEPRPEHIKEANLESTEEGRPNDTNDESTRSPSVVIVGDTRDICQSPSEPAIRTSKRDEAHTEPQTTIDITEVVKTQPRNRSLGNPSERFFTPVRELGIVGKPGEKVLAAFKVRQKIQEPQDRQVETDTSGPQSEPDSAETENTSDQGESEGSAVEQATERWEVIDNEDGEFQILEKPERPEKQPTEYNEGNVSQNSNVKPKRPVGRPRKYPATPEPDTTNKDSQTKEISDGGFRKKGRGRPRKYPAGPPSQKYKDTTTIFQRQETSGSGEANAGYVATGDVNYKRPVGRPRKNPVTTGDDNSFVSEPSTRTPEIGQWQEDTSRPARRDDAVDVKRFDGRKRKRSVGRPRKYPVSDSGILNNHFSSEVFSEIKPKRQVGRPRKEPTRPTFQDGVFGQANREDAQGPYTEVGEMLIDWNAELNQELDHNVDQQQGKANLGFPEEHIRIPVTTGEQNNLVSERSARTSGIGQWQEDTSRPARRDDAIDVKHFDGRKRKRSVGRPRKHPVSDVKSHITQNQASTRTEPGGIHDNHFSSEVLSEIKPKRQVGRPRKEPVMPTFQYGVFSEASREETRRPGTQVGQMLIDWNAELNQELDHNVDQQQGNANLDFPNKDIGFQRSRRGRPSLLSDIDESTKAEIIRYCLKHGTSKTAEAFTRKLGKIVSNQTVWRLMKTYLDGHGSGEKEQKTGKHESGGEPRLTPEQQKQVAKYAIKYGTTEATDYFSRIFGRPISRDTIARLKQRYQQLRDWTTEISVQEDDSQEAEGKRKQYRSKYSRELKNQIAEYSMKYGNSAASLHFSRLLNTKVPVNTVLALKYIYRKERGVADKRPKHQRASNYPSDNVPENSNYFTTTMESTSSDHYPTAGSGRRKVYNRYTQTQRKQIAEYSTKWGVDAAVQYFSQLLGTDVPATTVAYIRSKYNDQKKRELVREKAAEMSYTECPEDDDEYEERERKPMTKYNLRKAQSERFYGEVEATPTHDDDGRYADVEPAKFVPAENWETESEYNNLLEFADIDSENEIGSDEDLPHM